MVHLRWPENSSNNFIHVCMYVCMYVCMFTYKTMARLLVDCFHITLEPSSLLRFVKNAREVLEKSIWKSIKPENHSVQLKLNFSLCSAGFTLVCEKDENRLIAENVLDHVIRHLQEYCQIILQPSEASWWDVPTQ